MSAWELISTKCKVSQDSHVAAFKFFCFFLRNIAGFQLFSMPAFDEKKAKIMQLEWESWAHNDIKGEQLNRNYVR